jgi:hypothetical protein
MSTVPRCQLKLNFLLGPFDVHLSRMTVAAREMNALKLDTRKILPGLNDL